MLQKILHFPLIKIIVGIVVCVGIIAVGGFAVEQLLGLFSINNDVKELIEAIMVAVLAIGSYHLLFRFYEKRTITELSAENGMKFIIIGVILGLLLQSLTILVIYLQGGYSVVSVNPVSYLILPLSMGITSGVVEEIIIRGIIFRIIEEKLGSYWALFISALLFGMLHIANPNSSFLMALGLSVQAGLLLGVAFIFSRNLWFPIAIHFAWNFSQSGIFGAAVSGGAISKTLVTAEITGENWFTGGNFGPEGSIQATLFCLVAAIILLILSCKNGRIISPYWKINDANVQQLKSPII